MLLEDFDALASAVQGKAPLVLQRVERLRRHAVLTGDHILSGEELEGLLLTFGSAQVWFICDPDYDELQIQGAIPEELTSVLDLSSSPTWKNLVGLELFEVWLLKKNGEHNDGFQLSFGKGDDRIQLDGAASTVRIWSVENVPDKILEGAIYEDNSEKCLPTALQIEALGVLFHYAFVEIRKLTAEKKAGQAHELADVFHNIPREIYGWGNWNRTFIREDIAGYVRKYRGSESPALFDYPKLFDDIFSN